jgi:hypothetical protein
VPVKTPVVPDIEDTPFSHGLFDKDPATTAARKGWLKISIFGVVVLFVMIWGVLPIYWAAIGRSFNNVHNLSGYVVVRFLSITVRHFLISISAGF